MRSSISNSDLPWVIKLIGGFLAAFSLIHFCVVYLAAHAQWASRDLQAPGLQNEVIVERYAFSNSTKPCVIVGSSVSTRLPPENCNSGSTTTIFIQRSSGMTGLEAIIRSGNTPQLVLVEGYFLDRGCNDALLDSVFGDTLGMCKNTFPALRDEFNLINLFYKQRMPVASINDHPHISQEEYDSLLDKKIEFISRSFPQHDIKRVWKQDRICRLKQQLNILKNRGARVVFFMTPLDSRLENIYYFVKYRELFFSEFGNDYEVIAPRDGQYYYMSDGIHFLYSSGKEYYEYILEQAGIPGPQ